MFVVNCRFVVHNLVVYPRRREDTDIEWKARHSVREGATFGRAASSGELTLTEEVPLVASVFNSKHTHTFPLK